MSLQKCIASRKDFSGSGDVLKLLKIQDICKATHQVAPTSTLFIALPNSPDYKGGVYKFDQNGLEFINDEAQTKYTLELYLDLDWKDPIELKESIRVGLPWQYL